MPTTATPLSVRSRPSAASPAATCLTYGQWLQMKVTTSAEPARSSRLTVAPVAGSGSVNGGAGVPRASMVDSVAMPARVDELRFLMPDVALVQAKGAVVKGGRRRQRNTRVNTTHRRVAVKLLRRFASQTSPLPVAGH